jgi:tRNA A-37 threonylcarbamoyl transferase component Bud32
MAANPAAAQGGRRMNRASPPSLKLSELANAGRVPELPVVIELAEDADIATLCLERLLRVLPGRRYVGEASWKGQKALAKLLTGPKAARHLERERQGALLLAAEGVNTPRLLAAGALAGEGGWLLFEWLEGAESLGARWRALEQQTSSPAVRTQQFFMLGEALRGIAALHARGLWQEDLHLDNLLDCGGRLYLVDGAGIRAETPGAPLSRQRTLENLGLFFAQLPIDLDAQLDTWLQHYLRANPAFSPSPADLEILETYTRRARQRRIRDLLKKIGRDCSLFCARKIGFWGARGFCVARRDEAETLAPLFADPDAFIASAHLCKAGDTATVARVDIAGRSLIIKRYNIKHAGHWLTRFWRPSRAWRAWREGNRLMALGIATARPLAIIERRWLWLRGTAFLITEYLEGQDAMACFQAGDTKMPELAWANELAALRKRFVALRQARIHHGDCKGHNLIWQAGETGADGRWALIDLDATRQCQSACRFSRAYARDRARFLRNWEKASPLYRWLDENLPR